MKTFFETRLIFNIQSMNRIKCIIEMKTAFYTKYIPTYYIHTLIHYIALNNSKNAKDSW